MRTSHLLFTALSFLLSEVAARQHALLNRQMSSSSTDTSLLQLHTKFPVPLLSSSPYSVQTNIPAPSSTSSTTSSSSALGRSGAIALVVVLILVVVFFVALIGLFVWRRRKYRQAKAATSRNTVLLDRRDSSLSTRKFDLTTEPEPALLKS